jgi:hypothetical protein
MATEQQEHARTQRALDKITKWGRDPVAASGENITFSIARQGASDPADACLAGGDCTPFTASGHRGTLKGQPPGFTGEPFAYFLDFTGSAVSVTSVSCQFTFDLNRARATRQGPFPNLSSTLKFAVEFFKEFEGGGGRNIVFTSDSASDKEGYVLTVQLVGA